MIKFALSFCDIKLILHDYLSDNYGYVAVTLISQVFTKTPYVRLGSKYLSEGSRRDLI